MNQDFGVMAIDPGGSSGVAWAVVTEKNSVADTLHSRLDIFSGTTTLTGHWTSQALKLKHIWEEFEMVCQFRLGIPCYLVIEDFILIKFKSSDRKGLYPVWIAGCLVGALSHNRPDISSIVHWQMPSAMGFATDQRLKDWGWWVKGRVHEQAATKHLVYFIGDPKAQMLRKAHRKG